MNPAPQDSSWVALRDVVGALIEALPPIGPAGVTAAGKERSRR
jgi:hypothetical protein